MFTQPGGHQHQHHHHHDQHPWRGWRLNTLFRLSQLTGLDRTKVPKGMLFLRMHSFWTPRSTWSFPELHTWSFHGGVPGWTILNPKFYEVPPRESWSGVMSVQCSGFRMKFAVSGFEMWNVTCWCRWRLQQIWWAVHHRPMSRWVDDLVSSALVTEQISD